MNTNIKSGPTLAKWILFTSLGWIIGFILALLIAEPLGKIELDFFGLGLGIATGIGLMQWLALREYTTINSKWLWLTSAGMGGTFLMFDILIVILKD